MTRVLTGLALGVAAWALTFLAPRPLLVALVAVLALVALHEFYGISRACRFEPYAPVGYGAALLWILLPPGDSMFLFTLFGLLLLGLGVFMRLPPSNALAAAAVTLTGVVVIAGSLLWGTRLHALSPHWLAFVLIVNAIGDSVALYVGKSFGRHALARRASPSKTWEGAVASTVGGTVAGTLYASHFLRAEIDPLIAALLALAINVVAQWGDLAESAMKRAAGIKDSGTLLPGHGGVLDRIDGLLFSLPVAYGFLQFLR